MNRNKKGFTLAELLVVVAIIGVLVAIAIPVFGSALENAQKATDLANVRANYAEAIVDGMTDKDHIEGAAITIKLADLKGDNVTCDVKCDSSNRIIYVHNDKSYCFTYDNDVSLASDIPDA